MSGFTRTSPFRNEADGDTLKSDVAALTFPARGFYVTGAGNVRYITVGGQTITKSCGAMSYHPVEIAKLFSTGTTATGIVLGW